MVGNNAFGMSFIFKQCMKNVIIFLGNDLPFFQYVTGQCMCQKKTSYRDTWVCNLETVLS